MYHSDVVCFGWDLSHSREGLSELSRVEGGRQREEGPREALDRRRRDVHTLGTDVAAGHDLARRGVATSSAHSACGSNRACDRVRFIVMRSSRRMGQRWQYGLGA